MDNSESLYLDSIRIRALSSVVDPDWDSFLQGVFEWYSITYHTPLYEVMDLPVDYVLYTYYRGVYRQMEKDERHNEAIWLLETPEERAARKEEDKRSEDEFMKQAMAHNNNAKSPKLSSKVEEVLKKMKQKKPAPAPEVSLPSGPPTEEITIKYMSEEEFEAELDNSPLPLKKK